MPTVQRLPFEAFVVAAEFVDGHAAFALGDGTVRLLKGNAADQVDVHSGAILVAEPLPDGKGLVTAGDDGRVALFRGDGSVETLAERPRKWIDQIAAGPNGAVAFASGKEAIVRFEDGSEKTFAHERAVTGLAFAPKGMRLAASRYGGVSLWWVNQESDPTNLEWTGAHIGVTFSPDGKFVVTSMQENALHGWKMPEGAHMRMTGYPAKPRSMSWSARGRYLATSGADAAVLWPFHFKDGPQGKQPLQVGARDALVSRVACHPKDEVVAVGYRDGAIAIGPFDGSQGALMREPGDGPVSALCWDGTGNKLAFGTEEGAAGVFDLTP